MMITSSAKICRQFASLPLGAKFVAAIDGHCKALEDKDFVKKKLENIQVSANNGANKVHLANEQSVASAAQKINLEFTGAMVQAIDAIKADADIKRLSAEIVAILDRARRTYCDPRLKKFDEQLSSL